MIIQAQRTQTLDNFLFFYLFHHQVQSQDQTQLQPYQAAHHLQIFQYQPKILII